MTDALLSSSRSRSARLVVLGVGVLATLGLTIPTAGAGKAPTAAEADQALDAALQKLVTIEGGPPGVAVMVQRGDTAVLHTAGVGNVPTNAPITENDKTRVGSVAKAFGGATALSVVADGKLALTDTVSSRVGSLPAGWGKVTLAQLLHHTSGIPDFSKTEAYIAALRASLLVAPPPETLLSYAADEPLRFKPGSEYKYSNSDNVIVGLMIEAATGRTFAEEMQDRVFTPLGLTSSSFPVDATLPQPNVHGYDTSENPPEDVSGVFSAGWAWGSGNVVASAGDANRFVRGYAAGATTDDATKRAQRDFIDGGSEPPGPGTNSAGLALFRYETRCGTVYGHTGNTLGYTQFVSASSDGSRSATVGINAQITPKSPKLFKPLRKVFGLAVCAALAEG